MKRSGMSGPEQDRMKRYPCIKVALGGSHGNSQPVQHLSLGLGMGVALGSSSQTCASDPQGAYGSGTSLKVTHHQILATTPPPLTLGRVGMEAMGRGWGPEDLGDRESLGELRARGGIVRRLS